MEGFQGIWAVQESSLLLKEHFLPVSLDLTHTKKLATWYMSFFNQFYIFDLYYYDFRALSNVDFMYWSKFLIIIALKIVCVGRHKWMIDMSVFKLYECI